MSDAIEPFRIEVPEAVLADLKERLARTRWPDQLPDTGWDYGTELETLKALCTHWRDKFDWRAVESRLNQLPHFTTTIDGQNLHFVHVRSKHENALPLILTTAGPARFSSSRS